MAPVIAAATLWVLIGVGFIMSTVSAPRRLIRVGLVLLGAEFALLVAASASAECSGGPCVGAETITEATGPWSAIVTYVIPGLTAAFAIYVIAYGLRHHRSTTS